VVKSLLGVAVHLPRWKAPQATICAIKVCAAASELPPGRFLERMFAGVVATVNVADVVMAEAPVVAAPGDGVAKTIADVEAQNNALQCDIRALKTELAAFTSATKQSRSKRPLTQSVNDLSVPLPVSLAESFEPHAEGNGAVGNNPAVAAPVAANMKRRRIEEVHNALLKIIKDRNEDPNLMISEFLTNTKYVRLWLENTEAGMEMVESITDEWKQKNKLDAEDLLAGRDIAGFSDDRWDRFLSACPVIKELVATRWATGKARRRLDREIETVLYTEPTTHRGVRCDPLAALRFVYDLLPKGSYNPAEVQDLALALDGRELGGMSQALFAIALKSIKGIAKNSPYGVLPLSIAEGIDNTDLAAKLQKKSDPENHQALKDNFGPIFDVLRQWRKDGCKLTLTNGQVLTFRMKGGFDLKTLAQLHKMDCAVMQATSTHEFCGLCRCRATPEEKSRWHGHAKKTYDHLLDSLLKGVLDIDDIPFCIVHCKMRTTEHLLQKMGEKALENKRFKRWLQAARHTCSGFWAWTKKNGKRIKVPMMMGPKCEKFLVQVPVQGAEEGVTEFAFHSMIRAIFGPSDNAKTPTPFDYDKLQKKDKDSFDELVQLWTAWAETNKLMKLYEPTPKDISSLRQEAVSFANKWVQIYGKATVFTYLHYIACHAADLMERHGNLVDWSQQGSEHAHKIQRQYQENTTNDGATGKRKQGEEMKFSDSRKQVMLRTYRVLHHQLPSVLTTSFGGKVKLDHAADIADIAAADEEEEVADEANARAEVQAANAEDPDADAVFHEAPEPRRSGRHFVAV
jgi:hypothetical protein